MKKLATLIGVSLCAHERSEQPKRLEIITCYVDKIGLEVTRKSTSEEMSRVC
jgi:hypothetical protein